MAKQSDSYGITALRMDDILHLKGVKVGKVIGSGAFGTVLEVEHDSSKYAAKRMNELLLAEKFTSRSMKDFCRKCSPIFNLTAVENAKGSLVRAQVEGVDNLVRYIGIYQEDVSSVPLLVMELMHIELRYLLHVRKDTLSYRDKVDICHDIASGLNFLHSSKPEILHRNLHSNNILLDADLRAKIGDLMNVRLTRPEDILNKEITSIPGHEEYLPPEVFHDVRLYSAGGDIFSFGVLSIEIVTHKPPSPFRNLKLLEVQRRKLDLAMLPEDNGLFDLIHKCIKDQCSERPPAREVCDSLTALKKTLEYGLSPTSSGRQATFSELLLSSNCQIRWERSSIIPVGIANAVAVKDSSGVVYVGGGWASDAQSLKSITSYNPLTDHWSGLPASPVDYGCLAMVEKDRTKVIMVGGILEADWRTTDKLFTWEGSGKWKETYPCMSVPRLTPAVGVYDNKYLIVAGGLSRDCSLNNIEVLDLEKNSWRDSPVKLPYPVTDAVGSIAGENFIIMGKHNDEGTTNAAGNQYCILSIPISAILGESPVTVTTLPPPPIPHSTIVQNADPPLLLGGCCSDSSEMPGVFVFSTKLNNWKQVGTTTSNRAHATAIVLHSGCILVMGGVNDANPSKETVVTSVETGHLESL